MYFIANLTSFSGAIFIEIGSAKATQFKISRYQKHVSL